MPLYRPKIIETEAFEWTEAALDDREMVSWPVWLHQAVVDCKAYYLGDYELFIIRTTQGPMDVNIGDFIIKGLDGNFYVWKPEIFHKSYELADKPATSPPSRRLNQAAT
jgi:hypothetical protein